MFDKISQVDNSSTRRMKEQARLSITSRAGEPDECRIRAESTVGEGSVFTIELTMPVDQSAAKARIAPIDVSGSRILVIDDNPVNRAILNEQLTAWGFDACAAVSGQEGIDVLEAAIRLDVPVDAVVLDYHMPDMDGVEPLRAADPKRFEPGNRADHHC